MANITDVKLPDSSQYDLKDNVSGYAKKVAGATTDDLASLTATGDLADSGKKLSDLVLKADVKDVLNSTSTTDPLSANQGRVLNENVTALENVYGAKNENVYPYEDTTKIDSGITFVDNGDGSVTVSGTAGANIQFNCHHVTRLTLPTGKHKINGCPAGGSGAWYINIVEFINGVYAGLYSVDENGLEITADNTKSYAVYVWVASGTVISTPITFYPMFRDSRVVDDTWVPYAPTNRELMSYKANGKVGAKNQLDDDDYVSLDNMGKSGHTFTSNNTDTRNYFDFNIDVWNGTTFIQTLATRTVASAGHYEYSVNIPNNANRLRVLHNGAQRNIGIMFNTSVTGACIISLDVTGVDPTTVGGLSFGNIMIRIAEDTDPNYQPFAMTNRQLTEGKADKWTLVATVTGDGVKTWAQILAELSSSYNSSEFYKHCIVLNNESAFYPMSRYSFVQVNASDTNYASVYFRMINTNTSTFHEAINSLTPTDYSSGVFPSGYALKLYKIG